MAAQISINQLPPAGAITGSELVPVVQNGQTVQTTTGAIAATPSQTQTFLTVNQELSLSNSRYFAVNTGLGLTDGGALSFLRLSLNGASGSLEAAGAGIIVKSGASTIVARQIATSGAGLTVSNADGTGANPTLSLSGLAAAFANLSGSGIPFVNSGTTAGLRLIAGTANQIDVANGNAVAGNPTISLASNPVLPGTGSVVVPSGTTAQRSASAFGAFRYNTDLGVIESYTAAAGWSLIASGAYIVGPSSSVDSQIVLFDGTTGKLAKAATTTGLLKATTGVIAAAVSGTDYAPATSGTSILYGDGSGGFSNVTVGSGLSFAAGTLSATGSGAVTSISVASANGLAGTSSGGSTPVLTLSTSITGVLKGNGTAISAAVSGTDYAPATSGTSILYGDGSGGFSSVTIGTGVSFAGGTLSATGSGGTVTAVSVASANGFAGTSSGGATPALTLTTSITGLLKGNGTAISAAVSGTDYAPATTGTSSQLLANSGSGGFANVTVGSGLLLSAGTLTASASGTLTISNKTAAYTVVSGDNGTIINCTSGTFTVSLTAAATLGSGFNVTIWNTGTGAITIDPNASETIDGVATLVLRQGEGTQVICDGTNWATGAKKTMRGYAENLSPTAVRPNASGSNSVAIGNDPGGTGSVASGLNSLAIIGSASAQNCVAIGANSGDSRSVAAVGVAAMALGGSYASGADSFAAAIGNNTSSYGATGANSVAMGYQCKATGTSAIAIGRSSSSTTNRAICIGNSLTSSADTSVAIGNSSSASGSYSVALGLYASSTIYGKFAYASGVPVAAGDCQLGIFVLRASTTNATATVLTTNGSAASTDNQVILPNNSAYHFRVQVIGMQQAAGGTNAAGYTFTGVIRRGANAAATSLLASSKTIDYESDTNWDCAVSADTTNGGLAVTCTGAAATNIRWVATCWTSEVTYA